LKINAQATTRTIIGLFLETKNLKNADKKVL